MMHMQDFIEPEGELEPKPPDWHNKKAETDDTAEIENEDDEPRIYASSGEAIDALAEALKKNRNLYNIFCGIALKWIRWYYYKDVINDQTAADVVNTVINKIASCERKWNPDKTPNIANLVFMSIVSHIRNEWKKKNNYLISIDFYDEYGELNEANLVDLQRAFIRADLENPVHRDQLEDLIDRLFTTLKDDTVAYFVLEELLDIDHSEVKKPEALIALNLQISEPEVRNAIRRIKRKIKKIIS